MGSLMWVAVGRSLLGDPCGLVLVGSLLWIFVGRSLFELVAIGLLLWVVVGRRYVSQLL